MVKYKLSSWDLSEIKPVDLNSLFNQIEKKVSSFQEKRKLLTKDISPQQFMLLVKELEQLRIITGKLGTYPQLKFAENSSDQQAAALSSRVETFLTKQGNQLIFFNLWFKSLPEHKAND